MLLRSIFVFFSSSRQRGTARGFHLHFETHIVIWPHSFGTMVREATIIAQASISTSNNAFDYFLRILKYHKNVIDDCRFSSAVCGIFLVHNIEEGVKNNVEGVQAAEATTGHSMYFNTHSMLPPTTDELVYQSESLGWEVTPLAATIQNCCIAKEILHQLESPQPPPTYP